MESLHNIDMLSRHYSEAYNEAVKKKVYKLPSYLEDWKKTLNEIEFKFYSDIKSIGVRLYPYYPFESITIDFANPFVKVAVIILYKKSNPTSIKKKTDTLQKYGWTVYTLQSKAVTYSAKELFSKENPNAKLDFEDIDNETFLNFINKYSGINSECLLYLIRETHFSEDHKQT